MMILPLLASVRASAADMWVYFGEHLDQPGHGFYLARFDTDTGTLTKPQFLLQAASPGYFVIDKDASHLYAANAITDFQGGKAGAASAYSINRSTGALMLINQHSSVGPNPAYISLAGDGRHALLANYTGASIAVLAINLDGSLGDRTAFVQHQGHSVNSERQPQPHPHSIYVDPTDRFVLVPDLGLDQVRIYRYDKDAGTLTPNDPPFATLPPGSGPRHLTFHPNGRWVYVISEMAGTVTLFNWDSQRGTLTSAQTISSMPSGYQGVHTSAEVLPHPNGKFLYASNRGPDDLAVFAIDPTTGQLTLLQHISTQGKMPRFFTFDPTGNWLLVGDHDSNCVTIFRVDPQSGLLTQNGSPVSVPNPFCFRFVPKTGQ
jgi:6-phosphogluconolactonase